MKNLALLLSLSIALPALAERIPLPPNAPKSYQAECASCHMAYPPALLSAGDWKRVMERLDQHYGTDASLGIPQKQEISAFLERNAGNVWKPGISAQPARISQTPYFIRKHGEIPAKFWRDPRIKSAANCEACHRGASKGVFSEHDIAIPELRGD
ncbi:MAG: diheme cytochrome c [Betaproteobacteria bacterium]|nr:diheme cytochrome c [Betaproteobacteria bacterium]